MDCFGALVILSLIVVVVSQSHPCSCRYEEQYGGIFCDCQRRNLTKVPNVSCVVKALDLSHNVITQLPNKSFINFSSLVYLNLNYNSISTMEPDTFQFVYNLTELHLSWNRLSNGVKSFPDKIFEPLENLQVLSLDMNQMTSYPDWVFPPLLKLGKLIIDSVELPVFGSGFSSLKALQYLRMDSESLPGGTCKITRLTNETFVAFNNISLDTLIISCSHLMATDVGVFQHVNKLSTLIFDSNKLGVDRNLEILWPFQNRSMIEINLQRITHEILTEKYAHLMLTKDNSKYLKNICVKKFTFSRNHVIFVDINQLFGSPFARCIEHLDMSGNNILGDPTIIFKLSLFPVLRYINVRMASSVYQHYNNVQAVTGLVKSNLHSETISLTFPVTLESIDFSGLTRSTSAEDLYIVIINGENVKQLYYLNSNLLFHSKIRISGLKNVELVDISGNRMIFNDPGLLQNFPILRKLIARSCDLKFVSNANDIFMNVNNLEDVDLSGNLITNVPKIPNPRKLKHLILGRNSFEHVPIQFEQFSNLTELDLSDNLITQIDTATQQMFDAAFDNRSLKVRLKGNIFSCSCSNLNFIVWLVDTPSVFESNRNFSCLLDNGKMTWTLGVVSNFQKLSRQCLGRYLLAYTSTFLAILILTMSITYLVSKNPVRYRQLLLQMFGVAQIKFRKKDFTFTAYVAYCDVDIPFVFRKLKPALECPGSHFTLFLKDRYVLPGTAMADGVVSGIHASYKTIFILSREFLLDTLCVFSINVAMHALNPFIQNRIVIILLNDLELADIPELLLNAVDNECIISLADYENREINLYRRVKELINE